MMDIIFICLIAVGCSCLTAFGMFRFTVNELSKKDEKIINRLVQLEVDNIRTKAENLQLKFQLSKAK